MMQNLEFTYNYNLSLVNGNEVMINEDNQEKIDYTDKISLIDLITKFNNLYLMFKKDYKKIKKFDLVKRIELADFKESNNIKQLILNLYVINKNGDSAKLYINRFCNIVESYIVSDRPLHSERKYIKLNLDIIDGYFNLLEKYKELIDICKSIKEKFLFQNDKGALIGKLNGNILYNLDSFEFIFISYGNTSADIVELGYKLGKVPYLLGADVKIAGETIDKKSEISKVSNHILKNLYIEEPELTHDYKEKIKYLKI